MKIFDTGDIYFWKRCVLIFILIALSWYWYSGMMLHHIWDSPFQYKGADPAYWLFSKIGINDLILLSENIALAFSTILICGFILSIILIKQRWILILSAFLLLVYQIVFNMKLGYHTHHLFGYQFALLPFWFKPQMFFHAAGFSRILVCLTYFFAGAFKLIGKGWASMDSFANTLQNQHASYFYFHGDSLRSDISYWIIAHPETGWIIFLFAMCLQLLFISGLFTKRFDLILALFILLFHMMDWLLMNLGIFMGMTILMYVFFVKETKIEAV